MQCNTEATLYFKLHTKDTNSEMLLGYELSQQAKVRTSSYDSMKFANPCKKASSFCSHHSFIRKAVSQPRTWSLQTKDLLRYCIYGKQKDSFYVAAPICMSLDRKLK